MPLLGPVVEGFEDWLADNGYTRKSRKFSIRMLRHVDVHLRRRRIKKPVALTHQVLHQCWRALIKTYPAGAGTVRTLERYLRVNALMADNRPEAENTSPHLLLVKEYADYLHQVRGFAVSTISNHQLTAQCFLQHLDKADVALKHTQPSH
jgi:hypothetical protein